MEFGDRLTQFNILNTLKHPFENPSISKIDIRYGFVDHNLLELLNNVISFIPPMLTILIYVLIYLYVRPAIK